MPLPARRRSPRDRQISRSDVLKLPAKVPLRVPADLTPERRRSGIAHKAAQANARVQAKKRSECVIYFVCKRGCAEVRVLDDRYREWRIPCRRCGRHMSLYESAADFLAQRPPIRAREPAPFPSGPEPPTIECRAALAQLGLIGVVISMLLYWATESSLTALTMILAASVMTAVTLVIGWVANLADRLIVLVLAALLICMFINFSSVLAVASVIAFALIRWGNCRADGTEYQVEQMKFRFIDSDGKEQVTDGLPALFTGVRNGELASDTLIFDEVKNRWKKAREVDIFRPLWYNTTAEFRLRLPLPSSQRNCLIGWD